ncbi:hypothetical protein GOP47_0022378 [Adiantum capillus-veneris]|uniref:Uncharacterized protein n=1 Tax=Adiantum capillus-veneris TaxID=13818 RepID=A0A9D4Z5A3_ADICA|nr:hypothetical protein GOP47_0022378 [Adiantum capillus-veneris]
MGSSAGSDESAFSRVMEVAMLGVLPMALKAAMELKVMDILAQHADEEGAGGVDGGSYLTATQIAARVEGRTAPPEEAASALDRILRVLASHGLLASMSSSGSTSYGLTPSSRLLLQTGLNSLAPFVLLVQDPVYWQAYYDFHQAVLQGGTIFARVHGMKSFAFTKKDPAFDQLFNRAMFAHSQLVMATLLDTYTGFQALHSLVDVGGSKGACLGMITSRYPNIKGINFDLPHVIAGAPTYPGVEHIGGDMFVAIPKGEAIFMKWILHDWSDDHCWNIFKNCYSSLPNNGKVIVMDAILPKQVEQDADARATYHMDLVMLAFNDGGKERTKEEFEALSMSVGFAKVQVLHNIHGLSVIEISKV